MTTDTNAPDAALLPCPHCGGAVRREVFDSERIQAEVLMCANHHLFGGSCPDTRCYLDEAAWNRRAGQSHDAGLLAALEAARDVFQHYGDLHAAKPDQVKAQRNYDLAAKMSAAIAAAKGA